MRLGIFSIVCALGVILFSGCGGADPQREITKLEKINSLQKAEFQGINARLKRISELQAKEIADLRKRGPYDAETAVLKRHLPDIPGIHERDGELVVLMTADILFDPGKDVLKSQAKAVLSRLAGALNDPIFAGRAVRVEGHTDSDPINKAKKNFSSNWDLGAARANAVVEYLVKYGQMDPGRRTLYSSSFSQFKPVAENKSKTDKARNRRVEVVVIMGR